MSLPDTSNGHVRWVHLAALTIILAFLAFRLTDVGDNPKGFFCDEASIGFNAASILETARDEHGEFMPGYFQAFGEYKGALYIYATALSIKLFGATHFATRLPAAIFLALAMLLAYVFLARRVHPGCGLLVVLLLGTEPWLHHFSHIAFELTAVPSLVLLSLLCWYEALAGKRAFLVLAAVSFCATFYVYPAARVFVPLMAAGLLIIYRDRFISTRTGRQDLVLFLLVALLGAIPFFYYLFTYPDFLSRVAYLYIFSTPDIASADNYPLLVSWFETLGYSESDLGEGALARTLLGVVNYFSYFSPRYLLWQGDINLRFGTPEFGVLSHVSYAGFVIGLVVLVARRTALDKVLLWWMLIYAIPGSLTWEDVPHSGRGIAGLIGMTMIAAIGFWEGARFLLRLRRGGVVIGALIAPLVLLGYGHFAYRYFSYYAKDYSLQAGRWMQYGYADMMNRISRYYHDYDSVRIVTTSLHYQPYIFALFYSGIDPQDWQRHKVLPWRIENDNQPPEPDGYREHVLYVFAPIPDQIEPGLRLLAVGNWEDGTPAYGFFDFVAPAP